MFCSKCGKENPDGNTFCSSCGAPLQGSAPSQTQDMKNLAGGFLKSMQEKAKTMGESINKAAEEARAVADEEKAKREQFRAAKGISSSRFEHYFIPFDREKGNDFSNSISAELIIDRQTGVNYLLAKFGDGAGLSVLVDADGKPLVTKIDDTDNEPVGPQS
ncbi:MAG: zinc ribbon domain-containing protein [Butyrivibrio sp.]|nr:zinc ribbon domain-containing protein [Butyrivibrio sp.]